MEIIEIKGTNQKICKQIADVHMRSFKNFFLTSLGVKFIRFFYTTCIRNPNNIFYGLFNDEKLIGFCTGTSQPNGFYKNLITKNIIGYSYHALMLGVFKPRKLLRLILNIDRSSNNDSHDYFEILSLCILPEYSNMGKGSLLLKEFEKKIKASGYDKVSLTTDSNKDNIAMKYYQKLGYKVLYETTVYPSRKMARLIKKIK